MTIVETRPITGGVDTHLDVHVAAALDPLGWVVGVESFPASGPGYRELFDWLCRFGDLSRVGVEGTGAYGAGLARFLHGQGVEVIEVDRPNRQARRRQGKSDPADAVEAARAALSGRARGAILIEDLTAARGTVSQRVEDLVQAGPRRLSCSNITKDLPGDSVLVAHKGK